MDGLLTKAGLASVFLLTVLTVRVFPGEEGSWIHTLKTVLFQTDGQWYNITQSLLQQILVALVSKLVIEGEISFNRKCSVVALLIGLCLVYALGINQPEYVKADNCRTEAGIVWIHRRSHWGAIEPCGPLEHKLDTPAKYVVISHTVDTARIETTEECINAMKRLQQVDCKKFSDIPYNYVVCNDGHIYEGRGHQHKGATAKGWNNGIGFAFIGTYVDSLPSQEAMNSAKAFLQCLVDDGVLTPDFSLYTLRQVRPHFPEAPGDPLYNVLKQWKGKGVNTWSWREP